MTIASSKRRTVRCIALLAAYNEERFIEGCIRHLAAQGVDVYLIDNGSDDGTIEIAERYLGRGVAGIETLPRSENFRLRTLLERKEQLAATLDADWFMHVDADEIRLPPTSGTTLAEAFADVEEAGFNAVNFLEYTFTPTRESPDHDHPRFVETMRWYYPYLPAYPHKLSAWKRPEYAGLGARGLVGRAIAWKRGTGVLGLADGAGHRLSFPGLRMYPQSFPFRHYIFLSIPHAIRKYEQRNYDPEAVRRGWHGWRASVKVESRMLPSDRELRTYVSDDALDPSNPRTRHYMAL